MDADLKWLMGLGNSVAMAIVTTMIAAFRNLAAGISTGQRDIHGRIDQVKDDYVRRDDLDGHIQRIDQNVRELRDEMRENHRQLIAALGQR